MIYWIVVWSILAFLLDALLHEWFLRLLGRVVRKLDWFIYERPVIRRLEREEREKEKKRERVVCIHVGPYR
jgi:hypothetical protein